MNNTAQAAPVVDELTTLREIAQLALAYRHSRDVVKDKVEASRFRALLFLALDRLPLEPPRAS